LVTLFFSGIDDQAVNAFDVSQRLAWLAKERNDIQDNTNGDGIFLT
jgi:hypothetical protein